MLETDARFASRTTTALRGALDEAHRRIAALPGVDAAVLTRGLPMQQSGMSVVIEGAPADSSLPAGSLWVGPGFFDLLRIPLLYGRAIDDRDRVETVSADFHRNRAALPRHRRLRHDRSRR
jgi:hypothetical protein